MNKNNALFYYTDGMPVYTGDIVEVAFQRGTIEMILIPGTTDARDFSSFDTGGLLIRFDTEGLLVVTSTDEDLEFVSGKNSTETNSVSPRQYFSLNYTNGIPVYTGDIVEVASQRGTIEMILIPGTYIARDFKCFDTGGLLIRFGTGELHLERKADENLEFISRKNSTEN